MGFLTKSEAAIKLGCSVELIDYFVKKCPKRGEDRRLPVLMTDHCDLIDEKELLSYQRYLGQPWPLTHTGERPHIPKAIAEDVKAESHHACAVCGHMDNGELAHIRAFSASYSHSPDNLIYLCPNHHTKYDLGYKPSSNLTQDEVGAAKTLKRNSRVRMMRYEANAVRCLRRLIEFVARLKNHLQTTMTGNTRQIYLTELGAVLQAVPSLVAETNKAAAADQPMDDADEHLARIAPQLSKVPIGLVHDEPEMSLRRRAEAIVDKAREVLPLIDEVECPHCGGSGQRGLVGSLCAYCGGSCFVTQSQLETYEADEMDEVDCPRCEGRGQTGLAGDLCAYCGGECAVTQQQHDEYAEDEIDEVDCPHCEGSGRTGLGGSFCSYCGGSCFVSRSRADAYEPDKLDEVDCPRCGGTGRTGLAGDLCAYCRGDGCVTQGAHDDYDESKVDEVDCPHCEGSGRTGLGGSFCSYCGGSCFVSRSQAEAHAPDRIDEVECPRCGGRGQTGRVGDMCALCKGDCVVTRALRDSHIEEYGAE